MATVAIEWRLNIARAEVQNRNSICHCLFTFKERMKLKLKGLPGIKANLAYFLKQHNPAGSHYPLNHPLQWLASVGDAMFGHHMRSSGSIWLKTNHGVQRVYAFSKVHALKTGKFMLAIVGTAMVVGNMPGGFHDDTK